MWNHTFVIKHYNSNVHWCHKYCMSHHYLSHLDYLQSYYISQVQSYENMLADRDGALPCHHMWSFIGHNRCHDILTHHKNVFDYLNYVITASLTWWNGSSQPQIYYIDASQVSSPIHQQYIHIPNIQVF